MIAAVASGMSMADVARKFGVNISTVSRACKPERGLSRQGMIEKISELGAEIDKLNAENARLRTELDARPTTWAYDKACAALRHWRAEANRLATKHDDVARVMAKAIS